MQFVDDAIRRSGKNVKRAQKAGWAIQKAVGGKIGANLGKFMVNDVIEPLATAGVEKGVSAIQGAGCCVHCGYHSGRHPTKIVEHHYASEGSGAFNKGQKELEEDGYGFAKGSIRAHEAMEKARSHIKGGKARFEKGSPEAKAHMAALRAMRGKK